MHTQAVTVIHKGFALEASLEFAQASPAARDRVSNGVGPDWFPAWLRRVLDWRWLVLGMSAVPSADIHDWDCAHASTEHERVAADRRFLANLERQAAERVQNAPWWWKPVPWLLLVPRMRRAHTLYLAVRLGTELQDFEGEQTGEGDTP